MISAHTKTGAHWRQSSNGSRAAFKPAAARRQQPHQQQQPVQQQQHRLNHATRSSDAAAASSSQDQQQHAALTRRQMLGGAAGVLTAVCGPQQPALAFISAPEGYRAQVDRLDGYSFIYPDQWTPVTSSGNDIFLRNPFNVEQNMFVDISSPSSSRYTSVKDLGSPDDASRKLLDRFLNREFMSTRLGVKREGRVLAASSREKDGRLYYDIQVRMTSYANRNPYNASDRGEAKAEWDRLLLTTMVVANNRLYQLRLQTDSASYDSEQSQIDSIRDSFKVEEVEQK